MRRPVLLLLALTALAAAAHAAGPEPLVGKSAPEIAAREWLNGDPVSLAGSRRHPVVIEFWATWCPPCREASARLVELNRRYGPKGVRFVSLTNEPAEKARTIAREFKMEHAVGAGSDAGEIYRVQAVPHAVIVGHDGTLLWRGHPLDSLEKRLDEALARIPDAVRAAWKLEPGAGSAPGGR